MEKARKDSRQRCMYVRQLQMAFRGRRPRRPAALRKENGELTTSPEEVEKRWHCHFSKILNTPSEYHSDVIDKMRRHLPREELDDPPTLDELLVALGRLKKGKAGGKTGILPELLLFGGEVIVHPESFRSNAQNAIAFARRNCPRVNRSDRLRVLFANVCVRAYVRAIARTCVRSHLRACEVHLIKDHQNKISCAHARIYTYIHVRTYAIALWRGNADLWMHRHPSLPPSIDGLV